MDRWHHVIAWARTVIDPIGQGKFAYIIWSKPWMSVNRDTFAHALLSNAGGVNVFGDRAERYPEIGIEELREANPDVILLATEPFPFKSHDAVDLSVEIKISLDRIFIADGEYLSWHGSRTPMGIDYAESLMVGETVMSLRGAEVRIGPVAAFVGNHKGRHTGLVRPQSEDQDVGQQLESLGRRIGSRGGARLVENGLHPKPLEINQAALQLAETALIFIEPVEIRMAQQPTQVARVLPHEVENRTALGLGTHALYKNRQGAGKGKFC